MIYELKDICTPLKGTQIDTSLLSDKNPYKYINGGTKESGYHIEANTLGNTVIVSEGGASCGYVNFIDTDFWCGCHCYKLTEPKVNAKYLYYALKANQDKIMELRTGAAMPNIKKSTFIHFKLDITNDEKLQKTIVSELDKIQDALANKNEQLKKLDELIQSKFYEMFGNTITNDKGWEGDELSKIVAPNCSLSYGIVQPGDDVSDGIPIVRPVDFNNKIFVYKKGLKRTKKEISDCYRRTILTGDEILFCVRGTTGTMGLSTKELAGCNVTRGIVPIFFDANQNKLFHFYQLLSPRLQKEIADKTNGAALKQINIKDLKTLFLYTPPLPLQQAFAAYVEKVEEAKAIVNQEIAHLQELLDSRMDYYFRK